MAPSGYEVGMYRDIGMIAQALRGIEEHLEALVTEVSRLADAQEQEDPDP